MGEHQSTRKIGEFWIINEVCPLRRVPDIQNQRHMLHFFVGGRGWPGHPRLAAHAPSVTESVSSPVPTDLRFAQPEDKPGQDERVLFLFVQSGAAGGYRTYDLSLTKGVLYH
jgi:hypothetical protein